MKLIPPPPPTVPIGRVGPGGQVVLDPNWALYLTVGLLNRIGGYNAPSIEELESAVSSLEATVINLSSAVTSIASRPPALEQPSHEETFVVIQQPASTAQQVVLMLQGDTYIEETYMLR